MQVNTAFALAFVNATAKAVKDKGDTPNNWVARAVMDKVDHTRVGTKDTPSIVVNSSRGTFVRK